MCLICAGVVRAGTSGLIQPFTSGLATLSADLLHIFDPHLIADGIVIASLKTGESVAILAGCNGIEALIA